jgi:hypothetical protein
MGLEYVNHRTCSLLFPGIGNIIGGVVDVMKESTAIGSFKEDIEKLVVDISGGLAIPPEQKDQVTSEIRQDIKETGTSSVNSKCLYSFVIACCTWTIFFKTDNLKTSR